MGHTILQKGSARSAQRGFGAVLLDCTLSMHFLISFDDFCNSTNKATLGGCFRYGGWLLCTIVCHGREMTLHSPRNAISAVKLPFHPARGKPCDYDFHRPVQFAHVCLCVCVHYGANFGFCNAIRVVIVTVRRRQCIKKS